MEKHSKIHESRRTCFKCGIILSSDQMKTHIKIHFKYTCDICGKQSQCLDNHKRHVEMHNKEKRHPCNECELSFQHLVELARHVTIAHRQIEDGKYECLHCKKIVSAIGHHLRTHQKDPKTCEICSAVLPNYSAYKSHVRYHDILLKAGNNRVIIPKHLLERNTIPLDCQYCGKHFPNKFSLIQHFKTHMVFCLYPCPYCELNTSQSLSDLLQHIGAVHRPIPDSQTQCNFCSSAEEDIKNHLHTHRADRYHCEICDVTSLLHQDHKKHYNRRHKLKKRERSTLHDLMGKYSIPKLNNRKVSCLECGLKVRISHMRSHITSHQTFKCMMCQKMFFHQSILESHERNHQRFSQRCPVCSQSFLSHVRLMAHLKIYHKMAFSASRACLKCKI